MQYHPLLTVLVIYVEVQVHLLAFEFPRLVVVHHHSRHVFGWSGLEEVLWFEFTDGILDVSRAPSKVTVGGIKGFGGDEKPLPSHEFFDMA